MWEETMSDYMGEQARMAVQSIEDTMDKFIATADVSKVYGERIKNGDLTLIPAGEVVCAMGFGMGGGRGIGPEDEGSGEGVGGGGGGWAQSRPVAVIVASPSGIRVEPVVDVTKIGLAALTAAGFMAATLMRMTRR
jgi:uncharacterized spore protein YtfJ